MAGMNRTQHLFAVVTVILLAACSNSTGTGLTPLSLALASRAGASVVMAGGDSTVLALGTDTLIINSAQLVLRRVELVSAGVSACDSLHDEHGCEEFEGGPVLLDLPLGAGAVKQVTVDVPSGTYSKVELQIHKVDSTKDAAFVAAHPGFVGVSIMVQGTFSNAGTRSAFTFTSSLNAEQESEFNPPLVVSASGVNVTLRADISTWFLNAGQTALLDPATANKGGANESVVTGNIESSFHAFHDDNMDGAED
jgi:hypothetical protein